MRVHKWLRGARVATYQAEQGSAAVSSAGGAGVSGSVPSLASVFAPSGFPHSVAPEYTRHHVWQFVRATASASAYVLSTHALLTAAGLSAGAAAPASVAINWVLKDGLGAMGVVAAAARFGRTLDGRLKRSRWVAECAMVTGVALEMATPLAGPAAFLPLASVANAIKGLAGMAAGAAKAHINQHFAQKRNLADVTARAHSQGIAAYLSGMGIGISLSAVTSVSPWIFFFALSTVQLLATERAISCLVLTSLDLPRSVALAQEYFQGKPLSTPQQMADRESFVRGPQGNVPRIQMLNRLPRRSDQLLQAAARERAYLMWKEGGTYCVALRRESEPATPLLALLDAVSQFERAGKETTPEELDAFVQAATERGWNTEEPNLGQGDARFEIE